jgi:hypothetical protein
MRRGSTILLSVLFFALAAAVVVIAYHTLWRTSSRTLFSVQENRLLVNLGRSALAEGYYELQRSLDQGRAHWFDWFTGRGAAADRSFVPARTRENAVAMSSPDFLEYTTGDVSIKRTVGLPLRDAVEGKQGVIDLTVRVRVRRAAPVHEAELTMSERRSFWFADDHGPFAGGGRHIALSATPAASFIEED